MGRYKEYSDDRVYNCKGIYSIRNKVNGYVYIGSASISFNNRWHDHKAQLKGNRHVNKYLQRAYNKYGKDNFEFNIIEVIDGDKVEILQAEQYYLDVFYGQEFCYNLNGKAKGGTEKDRYVKNYGIVIIGPDGVRYDNITNLNKFAREHDLNPTGLQQLKRGTRNTCIGYTIEVNDDILKLRDATKIKSRNRSRIKSETLRKKGLLKDVGRPSVDFTTAQAIILIKAFYPNLSLRTICTLLPMKVGYVTVKHVLDRSELPMVQPISLDKKAPSLDDMRLVLKDRLKAYAMLDEMHITFQTDKQIESMKIAESIPLLEYKYPQEKASDSLLRRHNL